MEDVGIVNAHDPPGGVGISAFTIQYILLVASFSYEEA